MDKYNLYFNDKSTVFIEFYKELYKTKWSFLEYKHVHEKNINIDKLDKSDLIIFKNILSILTSLDSKINFDSIKQIQEHVKNIDPNNLVIFAILNLWSSIESEHALSYNDSFISCFPDLKFLDNNKTISKFISLNNIKVFQQGPYLNHIVSALLIEGIIIPIIFEILFTIKFKSAEKYYELIAPGVIDLNLTIIRDEFLHRDLTPILINYYYNEYKEEIINMFTSEKSNIIDLINEIFEDELEFMSIKKEYYFDCLEKLFDSIIMAVDKNLIVSSLNNPESYIASTTNSNYTKQFENTNIYYNNSNKGNNININTDDYF
jgi:hypothetical protein